MKIKKAIFVKGIVKGKDSWNPEVPQVAFYGRSNVGKSSSVNALLNNGSLAKTSGMPGKTKEINLFNINDNLYFLDLPGYGFARGSQKDKEKLQELILWFIVDTHVDNRTHVMVIDSKVGLTDLDRATLDFLYRTNERIIILLNKIDKLNQKEFSKVFNGTRKEVAGIVELIPFSAKTKKGVVEFWKTIENKTV
jgi:GTP-binding protein